MLSVVICHGFVVLRKNLVISDVSFYRDAVTFSNLVSMRNQRLIDKGMAPIEYELSLYVHKEMLSLSLPLFHFDFVLLRARVARQDLP